MKQLITLATAVMLVLCTGCGDSHEKLAGESVSTMKELVSTLENVKDADSAKANKSKLKSLMQELKDINARETKLGAPSEAEIKAMDAKYGKEMEELQRKMAGQMMRIAFDPKIQAELSDIDMKKPGG